MLNVEVSHERPWVTMIQVKAFEKSIEWIIAFISGCQQQFYKTDQYLVNSVRYKINRPYVSI